MKPLEIYCRNRVMYVQMTVHDKSMGMKDYHLYSKNGLDFYVFRKSQGIWELAYGELADDIEQRALMRLYFVLIVMFLNYFTIMENGR